MPTVAVVTRPFQTLVEGTLEFRKFEGVPIHVLPYPTETLSDDELRALADEHLPEILAKLQMTTPDPS